MRILLTGAAGFIGSHLCDALIREGHSVIGVDNQSTGDIANLDQLRSEPRFEFVEQDITRPFSVGAVEYVLNFACPASPIQYSRLGLETLRAGSIGVFNMLEIAKEYGARFLQASTSECYGDPEVHPQPETYWGNVNPIGPRSVYDESKRFGEAAVIAYHRYENLDTRIVRIFNTYGPRLAAGDGRVVSNFIVQALAGADITVYGEGSQTRSFCYISDLIDGIVRLMNSEEHLPVNIGNPVEWTVLELARKVIAVTGSSSRIQFELLPEDDPMQRRPDISKAQRLLGWTPRIDLDTGLIETISYFRTSGEPGLRRDPLPVSCV